MFRRILVGFDGSAAAQRALEEAAALAQRDGAAMTVLTALPLRCGPLPAAALAGGVAGALERDAEQAQVDGLRALAKVGRAVTATRWGTPGRVLVEAVGESAADLLVVGTSRRRVRRGTAKSLARRARIPVLAVGADGSAACHVP